MSGHEEEDHPIDRSLIDAAVPALEPSEAQRSRLKRAVLGAIATSAVTTGTAAGAQAAAGGTAATAASATGVGGAAVGMGLGAKAVVAAIAIASVVGVVAVSRTPSATPASGDEERAAPSEIAEPSETHAVTSAPPSAPVAEPAPPEEAPSAAPVIEPAPAPIAASPLPRRPTPTAAAPAPEVAPSPEVDPAVVETMLLARARVALQRHDGATAMQLLQEHASRFPSGELREERLALRISTLCELGETDRAHREAASYLDAFPGSIHAADVRAADCWSHEPTEP
ncbi:MAG: hypothetical protein U0234_22685 [Sandaracinus sp.]